MSDLLLGLDEDLLGPAAHPAAAAANGASAGGGTAPEQSIEEFLLGPASATASASAAGAATAGSAGQGKPPPPPPPPPPPASAKPASVDLNEVYRPYEDPAIKTSFAREPTGDLLLGTEASTAAVLFATSPRQERASTSAARGGSLLDFGDDDDVGGHPAERGASGAGDGVLPLPAGLLHTDGVDRPKAVIDLSKPAAAEQAQGSGAPKAQARSRAGSASTAAAPKPIPTDAKGFGSDDLFGGGGQERTIQESIQGEAAVAYNAIVGLLPEQMKHQLPSCTAPETGDAETEIAINPLPATAAHGNRGGGASSAAAAGPSGARTLEEQHAATAVNRACEGRWVPTYMRQQLAANGHTTLPARANGHEHSASAQAQAPPASLGQAFAEMGSEFGETAQTMFEFVIAMLSSLTLQCQMCSHQAATRAHEQVITFGENLCHATGNEEEEVNFGRPVDEAIAGLGPVRSRVQRTVPGVSFEQLTAAVRTKLITPLAPPEFARTIRQRELTRSFAQHFPATIEDWIFKTEVNADVVDRNVLQHVCRNPENPIERKALVCREQWHVELSARKATVEMTNAPAGGAVILTLRLDIVGLAESEGGGCEVDSRLYARPRESGAVLPIGLVEQLTELHHVYSENLRDVVLTISQGLGGQAFAQRGDAHPIPQRPAAQGPGSGAPSQQQQLPHLQAGTGTSGGEAQAFAWRAPAMEAPGSMLPVPQKVPIDTGVALDAKLLLKVADGI